MGPPLSREKSRDVLEQPPEYLLKQEDSSELTLAFVIWKVASRFLAAAAACRILLMPFQLRVVNRKKCSGCMKVANGALAADVSEFWRILCSSLSM